jgi:hypothetical protein
LKRVRRYYAVISDGSEPLNVEELRGALFHLAGSSGVVGVQLSVLKMTSWGFILRLRDISGKNAKLVPLVLELCSNQKSVSHCVAASGTLKGLGTKLKEIGLQLQSGMK